jgi:hypothetical protein
MKPGDLCELVGTTGWGEVCLVIRTNANGVGGVEVLLESGKIAIIGRTFLQVISEAR